MQSLRLRSPLRPNAQLRPPGSKSLSNRALLLAAMAEGSTTIRGLLDAEDTQVMLHCMTRLGIWYQRERIGQGKLEDGVVVEGTAGTMGGEEAGSRPNIDVATAGTVARFLTAVLAAAPKPGWSTVTIDGSARMRERPMDTLLASLTELGANIEALGKPGALPCRIQAARGISGGTLQLDELASSQFVSALVIAGSWSRIPLRLVLRKGTPARPYVDMTLDMLARFGGRAGWVKPGPGEFGEVLAIEPSELRAPSAPIVIEPDASAASYLLALPVIWGGSVTVPELGRKSTQGDAKFCEVLARFGAEVEQDDHTTKVSRGSKLRGCKGNNSWRSRITRSACSEPWLSGGAGSAAFKLMPASLMAMCNCASALACEVPRSASSGNLNSTRPPGWNSPRRQSRSRSSEPPACAVACPRH